MDENHPHPFWDQLHQLLHLRQYGLAGVVEPKFHGIGYSYSIHIF